jgi:energy-coupling factor transporter ATP-binding protein EcfA2
MVAQFREGRFWEVVVQGASGGFEVLGVQLAAPPPVSRLMFELRPGLTAIYGKNGVGKTNLLRETRRLLALLVEPFHKPTVMPGEAPDQVHFGEANVPHPLSLLYCEGGLHVRQPIVDGGASSLQLSLLDARMDSGFRDPGDPLDEEAQPVDGTKEWETDLLYVMSRLPFDASVDEVEYLLEAGRWLISATPGQPATICDPDPHDGPLRRHWEKSSAEWKRRWGKRKLELRFDEAAAAMDGHSGWEPTFESRYRLDRQHPLGKRRHPGLADPPGLPPLPDLLGLDPLPDFVAAPVATLCYSTLDIRSIWETPDADVGAATVQALPFRLERHKARATERFPLAGRTTEDVLRHVTITANRLLAELFDEPPLLRAHLTTPEDWFRGRAPVRWTASTDLDGPEFDLPRLGRAHRRYAEFAIRRALDQSKTAGARMRGRQAQSQPQAALDDLADSPSTDDGATPTLSFALIDEPEAALHPSAEVTVARGLRNLADFVIVATHSTQVVDNADHVKHMTRPDKGPSRLVPLGVDLDLQHRQFVARQLGQTQGTLALLTRVVLLVEGPMDEAVIRAFLGPELEASRTLMYPMMGTESVPVLPDAGYLFNTTTAPVVVCLDNTDERLMTELKGLLVSEPSKSARRKHLAIARGKNDVKASPEMGKLIDLLSAANDAQRLEQIHPWGFRKRDIVEYLPVDLFRSEAHSWTELKTAFVERMGRSWQHGDGKKFKEFVGISVRTVEEALDRMRLDGADGHDKKRPIEFTRLAERLLQLARSR